MVSHCLCSKSYSLGQTLQALVLNYFSESNGKSCFPVLFFLTLTFLAKLVIFQPIQGFLIKCKTQFFFFLTSLLEYNCFTMVCQSLLYNKVNQLYIYIYPLISSLLRLPPTLPIPPLQVVTKHQADLPMLCGCFPLAIYFTFGSV